MTAAPPPLWKLTPRERDVFARLLTGDKIADAAKALGISVTVANKHMSAILKKLGVSSRAELVALFVVAPPASAFEAPREAAQ